jgi:hypothetical protein
MIGEDRQPGIKYDRNDRDYQTINPEQSSARSASSTTTPTTDYTTTSKTTGVGQQSASMKND